MTTLRSCVQLLGHNLIAHPLAGVLWALGFDNLGDAVHEWWTPEDL